VLSQRKSRLPTTSSVCQEAKSTYQVSDYVHSVLHRLFLMRDRQVAGYIPCVVYALGKAWAKMGKRRGKADSNRAAMRRSRQPQGVRRTPGPAPCGLGGQQGERSFSHGTLFWILAPGFRGLLRYVVPLCL
jgi:hypothetical protein